MGAGGAGMRAGGGSGGSGAGAGPMGYDANRPHTTWMGQPIPHAEVDEMQAFRELHQLLNQRRIRNERANPIPPGARTETPISTRDLLQGLGRMDAQPDLPRGAVSIEDIKQSLLAQARQQHGGPVALAPADNDTFDLLGLLYSHLNREIREDAPAAALIKRLQLTLLRVALQDRAFFVRPNHPARQLLSTVSETAAKWLADDDIDPSLLAPLQEAVTHAVKHFDGDVAASRPQPATRAVRAGIASPDTCENSDTCPRAYASHRRFPLPTRDSHGPLRSHRTAHGCRYRSPSPLQSCLSPWIREFLCVV